MLALDNLHGYQHRGIQHLLNHPDSMLWLDMGLGKTIITLSALKFLMTTDQVQRTLVVAPLRVCQTVWRQEAQNWTHTKDLRFSYLLGSEKRRLRGLFNKHADIYLINYENLTWLSEQILHYWTSDNFPFQAIVWDEVSKMKHSTNNRGQAFRDLIPWFKHRIGLTGTPSSNGLIDLHGQFLVVDNGERLTPRVTHYRDRWFYLDAYANRYRPFPTSKESIYGRIHDITLSMQTKDYMELPAFTVQDIYIRLPDKLRAMYDKLEDQMFIEFDNAPVAVFNAAALSTKCRQFANGHMYLETGNPAYKTIHRLKMKALEEIVEETGDDPILLAYAYRSDMKEILKAYPDAVNLSGMKGKRLEANVNAWNRGEIKLLVGHPDSIGHGLNLQAGGARLVWFGLNWALDLYEQFNARLHRQGQTRPVFCHRIMIAGTVEHAVLAALESKATTQEDLRQAIKTYRKERKAT